MKRFILAIFMMAAMIGVGALSLWHSRHSSSTLMAQVSYIQDNALDNREASIREVEKLSQMWKSRHTWLVHHTRHHMMDEVGKVLSRARVYAENGESLRLSIQLAELNWLFHRIHDEEQFNIDNIL